MRNNLKNSNFNIIKIPTYGWSKESSFSSKNDFVKGYMNDIQIALNLHWKFVEFITENSLGHFNELYMVNALEASAEELYVDHGIHFIQQEGFFLYMIPKGNKDAFDFLLNNCKSKYKILTKINLTSAWRQTLGPHNKREEFKAFADSLKENFNLKK